MSIPISQFIPLGPLSPGNHKFVFYICGSFSIFVNKFICTIFFGFHIQAVSCICLSLYTSQTFKPHNFLCAHQLCHIGPISCILFLYHSFLPFLDLFLLESNCQYPVNTPIIIKVSLILTARSKHSLLRILYIFLFHDI